MEKKEIKIIGLDLDGTLLNSDKKISKETYDTLEEAARRGIEIVPSTGRYYTAMPGCIRELPFVNYAVTINGASVQDLRTGEKLYEATIPLEEAIRMMEFFDKKPVIYDCYMDDRGWMTKTLQDRAADFIIDPHYIDMVRNLRTPVPELKAFLREYGMNVQKVMFFTRDHDFQQEMLRVGSTLFEDVIATCSVKDENVEFNNIRANKGDAMVGLAERLGFTADNVMTFGDGLNDLSMIRAAGVGVAMQNSCKEVLQAADYVTLSNDEDGVAKFIQQYIF